MLCACAAAALPCSRSAARGLLCRGDAKVPPDHETWCHKSTTVPGSAAAAAPARRAPPLAQGLRPAGRVALILACVFGDRDVPGRVICHHSSVDCACGNQNLPCAVVASSTSLHERARGVLVRGSGAVGFVKGGPVGCMMNETPSLVWRLAYAEDVPATLHSCCCQLLT